MRNEIEILKNRTKGLWKKLKNFALKKSNFEFSKKKFPQLFKKFLITFGNNFTNIVRIETDKTLIYELPQNVFVSIW